MIEVVEDESDRLDRLDGDEVHRCSAPGCSTPTRGGKRYCSEHILDMPYAQKISARLDQKDAEVDCLEHERPIPTRGVLTEEVLWYLRFEGEMSVNKLARRIGIDSEAVRRHVYDLWLKKIVGLRFSKRGTAIVSPRPSDRL